MIKSFRTVFISVILIISNFAAFYGVSSAQKTASSWSTPLNLSNMPTDSAYPVVVSDRYGKTHVFWTENISRYGVFNNVIYYVSIDGSTPSLPVSIQISPQGLQNKADHPAVIVGNDDRLHMVFESGYSGSIYYSSAKIGKADNARSWTKPLILSADIQNCGEPNIALDPLGNIYVVFQSATGYLQGIYYTTYDLETETWSHPSRIPGTDLGIDNIIFDTRMVIAPDGNMHISWSWANAAQVFPPKGIYYIHSLSLLDELWDTPTIIVQGPYRYPDLAFSGDDSLLLTWSGTSEDRFKFSQISKNQGKNWSPTIKIPYLGGLQGYSGMAVDSEGKLHLAMVGSHSQLGDGLFHFVWTGKEWAGPDSLFLNTHSDQNLQYSDIAISHGNQAQIVLMYPIDAKEQPEGKQTINSYQFEIFYVHGELNAPFVAPESGPETQPSPDKTEVSSGQSTPVITKPTPTLPFFSSESGPSEKELSISQIVMLGAGPVIILWICVILIKKITDAR